MNAENNDKERVMDIKEIMKILPHRPPFLFVDEVMEIEENRILAKKHVKEDEYFFTGHFPGEPIMPGVLIVEAIAQAGGVMLLRNRQNAIPLFMALEKVRFRKIVRPGDTLILEVKLLQDRGRVVKVTGTAKVNDEIACEATILAGIREEGSGISDQ